MAFIQSDGKDLLRLECSHTRHDPDRCSVREQNLNTARNYLEGRLRHDSNLPMANYLYNGRYLEAKAFSGSSSQDGKDMFALRGMANRSCLMLSKTSNAENTKLLKCVPQGVESQICPNLAVYQ